MNKINCSVTIMPIYNGKIGFIRRDKHDTFGDKLVAPGGKVELTDGILLDNTPYFSVERAAMRELEEETGIQICPTELMYFCSLIIPKIERVVISFYCFVNETPNNLTFLSYNEIEKMKYSEFAPGMKEEALMLFDTLKRTK